MPNTAVLVVDVQNALLNAHPYNEKEIFTNIKKVIISARRHNTEIIYIRHNGQIGSLLEPGTHGWQIIDQITPQTNDKIIEKHFNSAFYKTTLNDYLSNKGITNIILVGLQTEYCIDATVKSAFDLDYKIIIPEKTNTTFDNEYFSGHQIHKFYNDKIWNGRFAEIKSLESCEALLSNL